MWQTHLHHECSCLPVSHSMQATARVHVQQAIITPTTTLGAHLIEAAAVLEQDSGGNDVAVTWIHVGIEKRMSIEFEVTARQRLLIDDGRPDPLWPPIIREARGDG